MTYRLLARFESLFRGRLYNHRSSQLGDQVAQELYEDLYTLGRSPKLVERVRANQRVLNTGNKRVGVKARRGDGTFGEIVPAGVVVSDDDFNVARGPIATAEIGAESKIIAKAMMKQIDRVIGDLQRQVEQFRSGRSTPICVAIVGINYAPIYTSVEGERSFSTDGRKYRHPVQEADEAVRRLLESARPVFDEFLVLRFKATNSSPYEFDWVDSQKTMLEYGAILTRVSTEYERRF